MSRVLVINPALGTGGGSRWSLQAAESLAMRGHEVDWVAGAPHGEMPGWRELSVDSFRRHLVRLRWPAAVGGRGRAWLSVMRLRELLRWCQRQPTLKPEAVLLDCVPFAMREVREAFPHSRIVFYCHFPEALYAGKTQWFLRGHRQHWVERERRGLAIADRVLVNSSYTQRHLAGIFPEVMDRVAICHPAVTAASGATGEAKHILCVARWTPEKNLPLAVQAYAAYRAGLRAAGVAARPLIIVGAFDAASPEAHAAFTAVDEERRRLGLTPAECQLLRDPRDAELDQLYREALALVHPMPNEHFGMVAPEAMARGVPVIGIEGSGLADSVVPGETGFLVPPSPLAIAEKLQQLHLEPGVRQRLGQRARERVASAFLVEHLGARLESALFAAK